MFVQARKSFNLPVSLVFCWLFIFSLTSCDEISSRFGQNREVAPQDTIAMVDSGIVESVLLTRVDQLRMRRYPNVKSNILTTLDDNMPMRYMGEETDFSESIGKYKGNWKRVKTLDGAFEGWVYSAPGFVEWLITPFQRDSMNRENLGMKVFGNLTKSEFAKLTGSSLTGEPVGTRYSGWYNFPLGAAGEPIDGVVHVVSKQLDTESKKVVYSNCTLRLKNGMPETELTCLSPGQDD